jgi:hypothetical protein
MPPTSSSSRGDELPNQPPDDAPLSPEASAALITQERDAVERQMRFPAAQVFALWGVVWVVTFGLFYLASEGSAGPHVPMTAAGVTTAVLVAAGIAVSATVGIRAGRGLRGPTQTSSAMIGNSYPLSFLALGVSIAGFARQGVSDEVISMLWTSGALLVMGILSLAQGAMYRNWVVYGSGIGLLALAVVAVFAGFPANLLVIGLGGGGIFMTLSVLAARRPDLFAEGV